jgi:hypothetical protein
LRSPTDVGGGKRNFREGKSLCKGDATVAVGEKGQVGYGEGGGFVIFIAVRCFGDVFGVLAPFGLTETGKEAEGEEIEKDGQEMVIFVG